MLGVRDAGETLGFPERRVWALIASGELKAVKVGGRTYIARADLEAYVDDLRSRCFTDEEAVS